MKTLYITIIKILIYIIPFIPLLTSWSFIFPYIEPKNYAFRLLVEFATAWWLGLLMLDKSYRPQSSLIFITILLFTLIVGLADLFGINPYKSFWSDYERMEGYLTILHLLLYFVIIKSILKNKKDWIVFLNILFIAGTCVSLYGLYHKIIEGWPYREYSTIGNPAFLASYLSLIVFIGLILFFNTYKVSLKFLYLLMITTNIATIYYTATRGVIIAGYVGMVFSCLFYIFGHSKTHREKLYKRIALSIVIISLVIPFIFFKFYKLSIKPKEYIGKNFVEFHETLPRLASLTSDRSVSFRIDTWKAAWEGFKKRPILGWGQENFVSVYTVNSISFDKRINMAKAHNIILEWLINAGILGLISYLSILGSAIYTTWVIYREKIIKKPETITLTAAIIVYFVQNLSLFDTINSYLVFFSLLAYIDSLGNSKRSLYPTDYIIRNKDKLKSIISICFTLLIFSITAYFVNYKPMKESYLTNRIIFSLKKEEYKSFRTVLNDFKKALSFNTFGDGYVRKVMAIVAGQILEKNLLEVEGATEFVLTAAREMQKVLVDNYYDLREWENVINLYHAMAFYYNSIFIKEAEDLIKECIRLNPKNQWIYLALADNYILQNDFKKALSSVKRALTIDPENEAIQIRLIVAGILAHNDDAVEEALTNLKRLRMSKKVSTVENNKLALSVEELRSFAEISLKFKNYNQSLKFYKELLKIFPNNAQFHYNIAEIYLNLNDKINAIKEAKKAALLDPSNFAEKLKKFK